MKRATAAVLIAVLVPALAWSGKVKVWHHHTADHHDKAEFKGAVLTSDGNIRLGRVLKPFADIDADHVWAIVEDKAGSLYVATGNDGKLLKVTADGKVTVAFDSEDSQVLSLAAAPDGSIYAGTGPSGLVVRVAPDGNTKVIFDSPESYVWSLAVDPSGQTIYAGTGPAGRIYQITPDGKATVFYTTKQPHILCLALALDGQLYAGTDKQGLVYRINAQGKGFVVFDAPQAEVRTLLVTQDAVYAGTSAPSTRRPPTIVTASSDSRNRGNASAILPKKAEHVASGSPHSPTPPSPTVGGGEGGGDESASSSAGAARAASTENRGSSGNSATAAPATGENSVYRIMSDGSVREVFRERGMILSLLQRTDRLLVGTGSEGTLYELHQPGRRQTELARLDHSHINSLYQRRDGSIVIGTADPGKLYLLEDKFAGKGTAVSEVLDAKGLSRWGAVRWKGEMPAGSHLSISLRSGNVAEPDDTWSDWSEEKDDGRNATVNAPSARFLQYRITLTSSDPQVTPTLDSVAIRYQTTNLAPELSRIEVPDLDAVTLENPKKLRLKWSADDPNDDELTYSLYVRKEGWKNWVELADDLDRRDYDWDTSTTPAGIYQVKVIASDRRDNPSESALTAERISSPFVVDHVPPTVELKVTTIENGQATVEAAAKDGLTRLVSASFSVDSRKWINVFPHQGLFDSPSAAFRFQTESLKAGTRVIVLRVTDAAGNTGSSDVVFEVKK